MKTINWGKLVGAIFSAFVICGAAASVNAQDVKRSIELTQDGDYFGFDLRTVKDVTLQLCEQECATDMSCAAFTYNPKASWCFLKNDFRELAASPGSIAGKVVTGSLEQAADIGAAPELSFLPTTIAPDARRYLKGLVGENTNGAISPADAIALADQEVANGDHRLAVQILAQAASNAPKRSDVWLKLAHSNQQIEPANNDERSLLQSATSSAAWFAYTTSRSRDERAEALGLLAESLAVRDFDKPALKAYQESLELVSSPSVQAKYDDLKGRKGFRITDQTVQNDAASARICVQLSAELAKRGVDYSIYAKLDNVAAPAIEAKGQQLCFVGLEHGREYSVTLRQGLPSADGEQLAATANFTHYIKDRPASMRFTGDSFVLPSKGRRGIPFVSVNLASADLQLYRVGDRALAQMLSGSIFRRQLYQYDISQISDQLGSPVWSGKVDAAVAEQNKEAVTSIPIDEILPERRAGVYVLTGGPEGSPEGDYSTKATQWFVISDIGLTTYTAEDGITLFARSLSSAQPLDDVELTLLAKNNEVLGEATTDSDGKAVFPAELTKKAGGQTPAAVIARNDDDEGDFVFLDLLSGGFDLSDRGVVGRTVPSQLDVFLWTERGIYRPSETVHLGALARDASVAAVEKLPLTFVFNRPDGVEDRRIVRNSEALGGYNVDLTLTANSMRGTWSVLVYTDPKLPAVASQMFLVDDFVPDRLEFDLKAQGDDIVIGQDTSVSVDGRYLYGAPAAGLGLEGDLVLSTTRKWQRFEGYFFGLAEEDEGESYRSSLAQLPTLDAKGHGEFPVSLDQIPSTTRLVNAALSVRLRESGGRAVERRIDIPVRPRDQLIGVKPDFAGDEIPQGSVANFSVIAANQLGQSIALQSVNWSLEKIERNYQWYREGNSWNYEPVTFTRQISSGTVDITSETGGKISVPTDWGRYRLTLATSDADGPTTSVEFDAGWYVSASSTETPEGLEIALDKQVYAVGETAQMKVSPRFSGELLIAIGSERLFETINVRIPKDGATIDIPVKEEWGAGVYVTATLFRPGEDAESKMPSRAIGLKWLKVDPVEKTLNVRLDAPAKIVPNSTLTVPVRVENAGSNQAYVMLAAVDVGILNLTRYEVPSPSNWFFGQRKLGLEIRDLYGRLIDGSLGTTGVLRSGGDGANMSSEGSPPTEKLVAFFSGPVQLDDQGQANISFDIPQFNGSVRLMAVAWSQSSVGQASQDVIIRDPIVVSPNVPRFLTPGDVADSSFDISATDAPTGDYSISIETSDHLSVDNASLPSNIQLQAGSRTFVKLALTAEKIGTAEGTIRITNGADITIARRFVVPITPLDQPITQQRSFTLAQNGGSYSLNRSVIENQRIDGASISVNVSSNAAFDTAALLMALDLYPHGCTEQTTSRALPLLYWNELFKSSNASFASQDEGEIKRRVQNAIDRVISNQSSSGSFGLWSPSGAGGLWLDAYVSEFLTRARENGFDVPQAAFESSLRNLQNTLAYTTDVKDSGNEIAYSLYVLARNKKVSLGDLRYYADTQLEAFKSPLAIAHLASGLSYYGDQQRTELLFKMAAKRLNTPLKVNVDRTDFGSNLRDAAAVLALAAEVKPISQVTPELLKTVAKWRSKTEYLSTQDQTWMVLASRALLQQDAAITLEVNGALNQGAFSGSLTGEELENKNVDIINTGSAPLEGTVTIVSSPLQSLPAGGNGFEIVREYYNVDGESINISSAAQNQRYVVVLKVTEESKARSNIVISDFIPAGFEIDNPSLVSSAELSNFSWLEKTEAAHLEFRNDRFVAAFERSRGDKSPIVLAYVVRAVTPGLFSHPAALVEDMYLPELSARTATSMMEITAQ